MRLKAIGLGVPCEKYEGCNDAFYKGYREFTGNTGFINNIFENLADYKFTNNEYVIINNKDTKKIQEMRFNGEKLVELVLPSSKIIKGWNSQQRLALDLLNNKDIPIKILLGTYGSGKTYLALRMGLYHLKEKGNVSKLLCVREPAGEGKEVGFLRGTFEDKTKMFFKPIEQSLEKGEFELQQLVQRGELETTIPFYLKGTTYDSTMLIVDESSDLRMKQLKLIGTRLGKNSMVAFVGDYKQSIYDTSTSNALIELCNKLKGNPKFGCVTLKEDVRSEASKIFAELD